MKNWTLLCPTSDPHWTPKYNNVHATMSTLSHHWLHERCHQSWYNSIQFNSIHFNSMTTHLLVHKMNFPRWKEGDARCLMQHILHIYSTTKETVHRWPMNWTRPTLSHIWPTSNQQMCALHDVLCNAHLTHHRVCDHTPAAAPRNYTRHKQPFSMVPLKSPIATVTVNSIRGVGLVVPHKTIQRRTYTEL